MKALLNSFAMMVCLLATVPVHATTQADGLSLEYIDSSDGIPQNSVRALSVDQTGFIWVGTEKGLARYDGHGFINFSELIEDMPEDVSLGVEVDSRNRIWTSWYTHSLRVLSPDRSEVLLLDPGDNYPGDLSSKLEPRIVETAEGVTWFPGIENIYRMDPDNSVTSFPAGSVINGRGALIDNFAVFGTVNGLLLIDTVSETIKRIDAPMLSSAHQALTKDSTFRVIGMKDYVLFCRGAGIFKYIFESEVVSRLNTGNTGLIRSCARLGSDLLIGTSLPDSDQFELRTLDINTDKLVPNAPGLPDSGTSNFTIGLYTTFIDKNDYRWVLTGENLYRAHGADGEFQLIDFPHQPFGLTNVFAQSHSGAVWARTDGYGLARFSLYFQRFNTITVPTDIAASRRVRSVAVDRHNNVWLVSDEQKLLYWNRSNNTWRNMLPKNTGNIRGIEILPDDSVWIIIPEHNKLLGYVPDKGSWVYEYKMNAGMASAVAQTRDGQLIAASREDPTVPWSDIFLISPHSGQMRQLNEESLRGQIRSFAEDKNGDIWVGTHEAGLVRVDSMGNVQYWDMGNSELSSNKIFSLHLGADNKLWVGTWHGGLLEFNTVNHQFKHYSLDSGLPDSTIFGILEDQEGSLWLSTYSGLVKFTPCSQQNCSPEIHVFTKLDGLQGDEFDADSHFKSEQGELFFAGTGGLNVFYPELIPINQRPPDVYLSRAQLNDKPLPGASSEFNSPGKVYLPYGFGEVRLEVSILDFNDPEKTRLQYRDLGINDTWKDMQQAYLSLRGLTDGTHTYEFRGANNDGVWSTENPTIQLIVAPPGYRHPLMLTLYVLVAALVPVTYFRGKQTRFIQTQKTLQKEVTKRTGELELANKSRERFFANVSHEICSPVHMILLMLENHMATVPDDERQIYKSATGYAAQLMVYLKQLVSEARSHEIDNKLYAADAASIIQRLVETNQPIARTRSISLILHPLPKNRVAFYSSSPVSIFSNLLCNALIYTPEKGQINISGEVRENWYKFSISNTIHRNQGVDIKSYLDRGSRGHFNANYFGGHGLGLSIVTSAVEILGGSIDVDLQDQSTIIFKIALPLATDTMPVLKKDDDLAFSHEQMLSIRLISDDEHLNLSQQESNTGLGLLIIEDDVLVANLLSQSLSKTYKVYVAGSYKDGIRLIEKHHPKMILCDLFLPDKSGFDVLKVIRSNRMCMDAFFVMMTASISEDDRLKSQQLGVDRFVRKPVSAENLKLLIANHLMLSEQRLKHVQREQLTRIAHIENAKSKQVSFDERFSQALEELYQNPDTTIEAIQTRLSMGYSALMRNCKTHFGKTPKRLLIEKRIQASGELLVSSDLSIGMVSELCGFSSHSQFSIVFRKETGVTPARFRKNQNQNGNVTDVANSSK